MEAKNPRHRSYINVIQWINDKEEVVHIFNRIVFSPIKNEIMPFVAIWMELEIVILTEGKPYRKKYIM